jgi:hypothetical protein
MKEMWDLVMKPHSTKMVQPAMQFMTMPFEQSVPTLPRFMTW